MSYDIGLLVDTGGPELASLDIDWNYTSNCAPMWRAAGLDLAGFHQRPARECVAELDQALIVLRAQPARFEPLNPPNGWGSYETLVEALDELAASFRRHPNAIVWVSR